MTDLAKIEGIGSAYGDKLSGAGISSVEALLEAGANPQGRSDLADKTGISGSLILEWVNHADLFRIKGIGSEYADLLEATGVDSVPELAQRTSGNLTSSLAETNEQQHLVRSLPAETEVAGWIDQAKGLERAVHH